MAKQYYLPTAETDKVIWLNNFAGKLNEHAATLSVDAATVTDIQNAAAYLGYIVGLHQALKNNVREMTAYKNSLIKGRNGQTIGTLPTLPDIGTAPTAVTFPIFARVQPLVQTLRNHPAYTESIGQDLGIIGAETSTGTDELKPTLVLSRVANHVLIKWKKGKATSIDIYVNRNDGKGFTYLINDYSPNHEDPIMLAAGSPTRS